MPILNVKTELTVDDLLDVVAQLNEKELMEFELGFEQIWIERQVATDQEAARIVEKQRLPLSQQARVRELLFKNREDELTEGEEEELDAYMAAMDQALEETADQLLKLADARNQAQVVSQL